MHYIIITNSSFATVGLESISGILLPMIFYPLAITLWNPFTCPMIPFRGPQFITS